MSLSPNSQRRRIRPKSDPIIFKYPTSGVIKEMYQEMKKVTKEVATKCIKTGYELLSHADLPDWLKDNEFLPNFHRPELPSVAECFKSIVRVHSETGNIWTHLVGQIIFILASINFYFACPKHLPVYIPKILQIFLFWLPSFWTIPDETNNNRVPIISKDNWKDSDTDACSFFGMNFMQHFTIGCFMFGANFCLLFSWMFHTFACHSPRACTIFAKLDYVGISVLITASSYSIFYYIFKGNLYLQIFYMLAITIFGTLCIIVSSFDRFATPVYRCYRAILFTCLGLFGVIPFCHLCIIFGFRIVVDRYAGYYVLLMGITYLSGATLYANRFPEKLFPRYFNIWFQSHQIHHVCVIIGLFFTLKVLFNLLYLNPVLI